MKLNPPQPDPSLDSAPYWNSLKNGVFALQRCTSCREWQFPILEECRHCSGKLELEPVSGKGAIYSYIINHRPAAPGFDDLLPYAVALMSPDEAPNLHIPGRIVGGANEDLRVGQRLTTEIVDLPGGDWRVPVFRLVAES